MKIVKNSSISQAVSYIYNLVCDFPHQTSVKRNVKFPELIMYVFVGIDKRQMGCGSGKLFLAGAEPWYQVEKEFK